MQEEMNQQGRDIKELTEGLKGSHYSLNKQLFQNYRQLFTKITQHKECMELEVDRIVKGIKMIVKEDMQKPPSYQKSTS